MVSGLAGRLRGAVEPLTGTLPTDAERGADLTPAGAGDAQAYNGGPDPFVVPDPEPDPVPDEVDAPEPEAPDPLPVATSLDAVGFTASREVR